MGSPKKEARFVSRTTASPKAFSRTNPVRGLGPRRGIRTRTGSRPGGFKPPASASSASRGKRAASRSGVRPELDGPPIMAYPFPVVTYGGPLCRVPR